MSETFETAMWILLAIGAFGVGLFTFLGIMHERAEQAIAAIIIVLRDSPKPLRG